MHATAEGTDEQGHAQHEPGSVPALAAPAFRGLVGDVVELFGPHTEASGAAIALQFAVAFGSAAGSGAYVSVAETRHHANEFLVVAGRTSQARKGDSRNVALRGVNIADPSWQRRALSGLSSGEGLIHHVRDAVERVNRKGELEVIDEGESDKRLCALESEFAGPLAIMSRDGNTLSATLRACWDGAPMLGNLTKNSPSKATGAHFSIIAHATPADLARYLSDTDAANGFGNRFLFTLVTREKTLANPPPVNQHVVETLAQRVAARLEAARKERQLCRTGAADELWCGIYPHLTRDRPGLLGDILARGAAHVLRLSLIYALMDGAAAIGVEHLESALAVWDYCEASAKRIFAGRSGNSDVDRIAEALAPGERMTRTEIREVIFGDHISAARLDAAFELLERLGWLRGSESTGGRSAEWIGRPAVERQHAA